MKLPSLLTGPGPATLVITDSGLGGLLICAELERRLRQLGPGRDVRLVYVNAWPDPGGGYNDLPGPAAQAAVFDRALAATMAFAPSAIVIACNTLSVVYRDTAFHRAPAVPVVGILDEGVDLFFEALNRDPESVLAVFGTRTTIGSGEHLRRLRARGIDPARLVAEACHGLAAAIDKDPGAPGIPGLVDACVQRALPKLPSGGTLYAGLACTHYAYVSEVFRGALARRTGGAVETLEPGERLVEKLTAGLAAPERAPGAGGVAVEIVSKVELAESQRHAVARRLEAISPVSARALLAYRHVPDLFRGATP
jgi:glutamate racemase